MKASDIDAIVVHCSAMIEGKDYRASDIDRWHRQKGWQMIGYNYVIDLDGTIETGRPISMYGAHCNTAGLSGRAYNNHSIGICYIGGLDKNGKAKDTRTVAQKKSLHDLIFKLLDEYPNIVEIIGHRDASPDKNGDGIITPNEYIKSCPCFDVRSEFPISICRASRK